MDDRHDDGGDGGGDGGEPGAPTGATSAADVRTYRPIGDYALLSDCHSTALVSSEGSIDWACLRRFDSGSAFARLLDHDRGGFASLRPVGTITSSSRRYLPGSMVLETTLTTEAGTLVLTDAFAMREGGASDPQTHVLRRAECTDGELEVEAIVDVRFDYGSMHPWLRGAGGCHTAVGGDDALVISSQIELDVDRDAARLAGRATLRAGESAAMVMVAQPAHEVDTDAADADEVDRRLDDTLRWWADWSSSTTTSGPWGEQVERSALVLKALTCAPTGAIVAAPTTSLPEVPGGEANWDYRYCWVRDATLALGALDDVGHTEVAQGFRDFILRSAAGQGDELQIMYGPYGERRLLEFELDLEGWRGASPVRVGNAAAQQTQLDVYGHLLDAAHLWESRAGTIDDDEWAFLRSVVEEAIAHADDPDAGIWELRGEPRHYVHSKVMVWVAIDRGVHLGTQGGYECDEATIDRWTRARDRLRAEIEERGVVDGRFAQAYDGDELDASLLKLPLVGFVEADDPRMVATVEALRRELGDGEHGFLRRFAGDGGDGEGVFLLCSFWLVEVLAMQGELDDARELFEALLGLGNDLGLFSEEYDVDGDEMLGNFPQAFTHLGVITAARRLEDHR